jgi:type I restriction enzyme S subunit
MSTEWRLRPLGEVAHVEMGQSPPSEHVSEKSESGLAFLQGNAEFSDLYPHPRLRCSKPLKKAKNGDALISVRAPVGAINRADQDYCIGRGLAAIRFIHADPDYGYHALAFVASNLRKVAQGTTFEAVGGKDLRGLEFPDSPPHEQRRIADILDTLDEAIRKTEQVIAKLQQMKQGLLHDLLTRGIDENGELRDPERHPEQFKDSPLGRIPRSWVAKTLGEVASIIDPNPSHRYPDAVTEGVPIASTENFVGEDDFDLASAALVPWYVLRQQHTRCSYAEEDVIFARKGRIGFARRYGTHQKVFSHTIVVMKPRGAIDSSFLLWLVRSRLFFSGIRKRMNTNSGVPTLGVDFLGRVSVPQPSQEEQRRIARILDDLQSQLIAEKSELIKLQALKNGLMDDLFSGRVRVAVHEETTS